jgi:hypothetical protein
LEDGFAVKPIEVTAFLILLALAFIIVLAVIVYERLHQARKPQRERRPYRQRSSKGKRARRELQEADALRLQAEIDAQRKIRRAENEAYRSSESGYSTNWDN